MERVGNSQINDCVPDDIAFHIRAYLDVLLGATSIEKIRLAAMGFGDRDRSNRDSTYAIPTIVDAVLKYNNIAFGRVILYKTKLDLIEPIWYDIDLLKNELHLFVNSDDQRHAFVRRMTDYPVITTSGIVPLERYNPYMANPILQTIDVATIHCAVMCDHVAQHIINEILDKEATSEGADIHDRFGRCGTTLHSMFDITIMGDACENAKETSRLVTILDTAARHDPNEVFGNLLGSHA